MYNSIGILTGWIIILSDTLMSNRKLATNNNQTECDMDLQHPVEFKSV